MLFDNKMLSNIMQIKFDSIYMVPCCCSEFACSKIKTWKVWLLIQTMAEMYYIGFLVSTPLLANSWFWCLSLPPLKFKRGLAPPHRRPYCFWAPYAWGTSATLPTLSSSLSSCTGCIWTSDWKVYSIPPKLSYIPPQISYLPPNIITVGQLYYLNWGQY